MQFPHVKKAKKQLASLIILSGEIQTLSSPRAIFSTKADRRSGAWRRAPPQNPFGYHVHVFNRCPIA
jgi:hypothetical protein